MSGELVPLNITHFCNGVPHKRRRIVVPDDGDGSRWDSTHQFRVLPEDIGPEFDGVASIHPGLHNLGDIIEVDCSKSLFLRAFLANSCAELPSLVGADVKA